MEFRLLGPLAVHDGDRSPDVGRGHQRALFALLLLNANEVVSTDRLIDELWGEEPPRTALKSVQVYVSRLRKELGSDRLRTEPPGYMLRVDRSELDLWRFEQLVAGAAGAPPHESADMLREALGLWRGPALADVAYEAFAQAEIGRLEELRWAATERRIDADLDCGRHAELIGELQSLVAEHPHREHLRAQLMLALYRSGRQADALSAYRAAQRDLSDELGLEPSEELRALEEAILRHHGSLDLTASDPPAAAAPALAAPESSQPPPRRLTRRLLVGAGAVILAAAIAAAAAELTEEGGSADALEEVAPDSLAVLDPQSSRILAQIDIADQPSLVAADGRSVWVASDTSRTISRIDGRRLAVTRVIPADAVPTGLAADGNAAWLLDRKSRELLKVDAAYRAVTDRLALRTGEPPPPTGAGVDASRGAVWVADGSRRLLKIDARSSGVAKRLKLPERVDGVAVGPRSLWAISAGTASVFEIDSSSGSARARIPITSRPGSTRPIPIAVAVGEGAVWVLNGNTPSVTRIDPDLGAVTDTIELGVGGNPTAIATGAGAVWVALSGEGSVAKIDPANGEVELIPVGGAPTGIGVSLGKVWISVQPAFRSALASRGRTIRVPGAVSEPFCSGVEFAGRGTPEVMIVSDLPLQNGAIFPTLQLSDAVRFVLARRGFRAGEYTVGYQSCDDSNVGRGGPYTWTPATCTRNARAYAEAPLVLGVIGPFESGCATFQIPILNQAEPGPLSEISGSATLVGLTHPGLGSAPHEPEAYYPRGVRNFARVIAADDVQGPAVVAMAKRLGVSRLFVLEDRKAYGSALAELVERTAAKQGVDVVGTGSWSYRERRFTQLANEIRAARADGVFFGGVLPIKGLATPLRDIRAAVGPRVQFLGPDGFTDFDGLVQDAGPAAEGMVISLPGVPTTHLPGSARDFVREFEAAVGATAEPYSMGVAQATEVLLDAIAASDGTRASVNRNLFRTSVENGILGDFDIDENGDTTAGGVTMYGIENGKPRVLRVVTP